MPPLPSTSPGIIAGYVRLVANEIDELELESAMTSLAFEGRRSCGSFASWTTSHARSMREIGGGRWRESGLPVGSGWLNRAKSAAGGG